MVFYGSSFEFIQVAGLGNSDQFLPEIQSLWCSTWYLRVDKGGLEDYNNSRDIFPQVETATLVSETCYFV